jgi:hypothetical protein
MGADVDTETAGFAVGFVDADGAERREPLASCAGVVAFEAGRPVRSFPSFRGQKNWPGLYWSAASGRRVGFESWLERDHAMLLDFDPAVAAFAPQPFWLYFQDGGGKARSHASDWFARRGDGGGLVVDCRPDDRIEPEDAAAFAATDAACAQVGWEYRRVGAMDPVLAANLRWLAGYRHPRHAVAGVVERVLDAFAEPRRLLAGARAAGDQVAVLPVVFHLLWRQVLLTDVGSTLGVDSLVRSAPAGPSGGRR